MLLLDHFLCLYLYLFLSLSIFLSHINLIFLNNSHLFITNSCTMSCKSGSRPGGPRPPPVWEKKGRVNIREGEKRGGGCPNLESLCWLNIYRRTGSISWMVFPEHRLSVRIKLKTNIVVFSFHKKIIWRKSLSRKIIYLALLSKSNR